MEITRRNRCSLLPKTSSSGQAAPSTTPGTGLSLSRQILERASTWRTTPTISCLYNQMLAQILWHGFTIGEVQLPTRYFPPRASSHQFPPQCPLCLGCLATGLQFRLAKNRPGPLPPFPPRLASPPNPLGEGDVSSPPPPSQPQSFLGRDVPAPFPTSITLGAGDVPSPASHALGTKTFWDETSHAPIPTPQITSGLETSRLHTSRALGTQNFLGRDVPAPIQTLISVLESHVERISPAS